MSHLEEVKIFLIILVSVAVTLPLDGKVYNLSLNIESLFTMYYNKNPPLLKGRVLRYDYNPILPIKNQRTRPKLREPERTPAMLVFEKRRVRLKLRS